MLMLLRVSFFTISYHKTRRDWLFEQYDNKDLVIIDSDDEGEDDDQLECL